MAALEQMAMNILGRCQDLSGAWERARENIRIFTRTTQAFRGSGPVGGDWILISEEFLAVPLAAEVLLAHELMHVSGLNHGPPPPPIGFEDWLPKEMECTGGFNIYNYPG